MQATRNGRQRVPDDVAYPAQSHFFEQGVWISGTIVDGSVVELALVKSADGFDDGGPLVGAEFRKNW